MRWSTAPYFNPRPLAGATRKFLFPGNQIKNFNPRPLAGATKVLDAIDVAYGFQSTPPCGGDEGRGYRRREQRISIHAPLRGRLKWLSNG